MDALYQLFHKQTNASLAEDSEAQEQSAFIDISVSEKG